VKEGGHRIVDEMASASLQARDVNRVLFSILLQENLLDEDEGLEAVAASDGEVSCA
jgi:hypothetical protein